MTSIKDGLQTANTSDIGGSEYKLTVQFCTKHGTESTRKTRFRKPSKEKNLLGPTLAKQMTMLIILFLNIGAFCT